MRLPASALLGAGLRLPHLNGIIISPMSKVGEDCTIFHQVTLGVNGRKSLAVAPVVGDRVSIGAGAKLIGPISIGDDAVIGANAVVTKDAPPCYSCRIQSNPCIVFRMLFDRVLIDRVWLSDV